MLTTLRKVARTSRLATVPMLCVALASGCGGATTGNDDLGAIRVVVISAADSTSLLLGQSIRLSAEVRDGRRQRIDVPVQWSTPQNDIISVSHLGIVQTIGIGTALVTARYGSSVDTVRVTSQPSAIDIRTSSGSLVETNDTIVVTAVYRGVDGRLVPLTRAPTWRLTTGEAEVMPTEESLNREVQLRFTRLGEVQLTVSLDNFTASRSWSVDSAGTQPGLVFQHVRLLQRPSGVGWLYYPDIQVLTAANELVVKRIVFTVGASTSTACGSARLSAGDNIPLFDFQPYNFAWVGIPSDNGAPFQVTLTLNRKGREFVASAAGRIEAGDPQAVIDYNTNGFPWEACGP